MAGALRKTMVYLGLAEDERTTATTRTTTTTSPLPVRKLPSARNVPPR